MAYLNLRKSRAVYKTIYEIKEMDCSSEERLVQMKLEERGDLLGLRFNRQIRQVEIFHEKLDTDFDEDLSSLNLGARKLETLETEEEFEEDSTLQASLLKRVLAVNAIFFIGELIFGLLANSMGLIADSLDMLADAIVYGLSLMAVGRNTALKKKVARWSGYFQLALALFGLVEVLRRFFFAGNEVNFQTMILVASAALFANGYCLYLLRASKSGDAHMQASEIFTSNDIIVNLGVIVAGSLVYALNSRIPDLVVGAIVFLVVLRGAERILKLSA